MLIIKNGMFIDVLKNKIERRDIAIKDGMVAGIEDNIEFLQEDADVIDAQGLYVSPSFIDVHVHFRDPGQTYKEDLKSGAMCAARGGYTTVIMMANTKPVVDRVEVLEDIIERSKKLDINLLQTSTVTKEMRGDELVDMDSMARFGCAGFTDDGRPIMNAKILYDALIKAKEFDKPISLHEEDPAFILSNGYNKTSPKISEEVMIARDSLIAARTKGKLNFQHISSKNSVDIIRMAKQYNENIFAEVTPHHFALTEKEVDVHGSFAKMNPPLREDEDIEGIINGIKDGTIDIIATDHAPHSNEEKALPFEKAPSGIIGLETQLSLSLEILNRRYNIGLMNIIKMLTLNPKKLYGLESGTVEINKPANITIFSENEEYIYDKTYSKSSNSPFLGKKLRGRVRYTISSGKVVYSVEKDRLNS